MLCRVLRNLLFPSQVCCRSLAGLLQVSCHQGTPLSFEIWELPVTFNSSLLQSFKLRAIRLGATLLEPPLRSWNKGVTSGSESA